MDYKAKKLFSNMAIFTVSNFASKLLVFLMLPVYTSILSTDDFGSADLIVSLVTILLPFLTLCIADAALRFGLDKSVDDKAVFAIGIRTITIGILILGLLFPVLIHIDFVSDRVYLIFLLSIPEYYSGLFSMFLRGIGKVKIVGIAGVAATAAMLLTNILLLVVFKIGITGYLLSYSASYICSGLVLFLGGGLRRFISIKLIAKPDMALRKEMLKYSIPLIPNRICWILNNTANKYILNSYIGVSSVGLFSAASRVSAISNTVQDFFSQAWIISAIDAHDEGNKVRFYSQYYSYYAATLSLICSVLIASTRIIAMLLFAGEYYPAWQYVPFLLIGTVFGGLIGYIGALFNAEKKTGILFTSTIIGAIASVAISFLLVPIIGIYGAAIASTIAYVLIWIIRAVTIRRLMPLELRLIHLCASIAIFTMQTLALFLLNSIFYRVSAQVILLAAIVWLWHKEMRVMFNFISSFAASVFKRMTTK